MTTAIHPARPRVRSIRQSVVLLQLSLQILFLLLFAIFGNLILAGNVRDLWNARLQTVASHTSNDVESQVTFALSTLKIAGNLDLTQLDENRDNLQGVLDTIIESDAGFLEIVLTAPDGEVQLSNAVAASILSTLPSIDQQPWFIGAASGDYIGDVINFANGTPYLIVSTARPNGGVAAGLLSMTVLIEALEETKLGEGADSFVVDGAGNVLAHIEPEWVEAQTNLTGWAEWEQILAAPDRSRGAVNYTNFEGEDVLSVSQGVPATDWTVVVEVANARAEETRTQLQVFVLLALLGFSVIAGFLNERAFSTLLFKPLKRLQEGAERVSKGDLTTEVPIQRYNELGLVTEAFNAMVVRIREQTEELKHAHNEAIRATRLAQENNRLKSEFLSTMSHELRTPLNAIEGFTSIMLGNMGVDLGPQARKMVERISANSKRLLSLINDFLDLSRIESGRMELVSEPISPSTRSCFGSRSTMRSNCITPSESFFSSM